MYLSDPELLELAESISAKHRRSNFENLLVRAELYSLVELCDHQGEYAPILIKRDFVLAILQDLRERGKLSQLLQLLEDDFPAPGKSPANDLDVTISRDDSPKASPSRPSTSGFSILRDISTRLPKPSIDPRLVITAVGLIGVLFVILYGNNLCQQSSPPPWTMPVLRVVCPPTATPPPQPIVSPLASPFDSATPTPQVISVGVIRIPNYIYTEIVPLLMSMGFDAEWVDYTSDFSDYRNFDIVYLPAGWGYQSAVMHDRESSFTSFLEQGGGLFIERPNAVESFVAYFLPSVVTFAPEEFDALEYPSVIYFDHEIIDGLDPDDLPEAGNLIENPDEHYQILTVTALNNHPTLLVSEPLAGRVLITSSTLATSEDIRHPLSEELVRRALHWLVGKPIDS